MAKVGPLTISSAQKSVGKATSLGELVYWFAKILNWLFFIGTVIALIAVYNANEFDGTYTDWSSIWPLWGAIVGGWIFYWLLFVLIMLFASLVQVQAAALEIQTIEAQP